MSSSYSLVDAIVRIAATCDMITVAEGVETSEQLDRLRELGCRQVQGYLFSRPVPGSAVMDFSLSNMDDGVCGERRTYSQIA